MENKPFKARVKPFTWDRHEPEPIPGAFIYGGKHRVFIPADQLFTIADALVDVAENTGQDN